MLICAIDTSGRDGSLVLAEANNPTQANSGRGPSFLGISASGSDAREAPQLEWGTLGRDFECMMLHSAAIAGGTYSAKLIPTLAEALAAAGKQKSEIGLLVVASGPGSFTGLRVGISTVKALAEVLQVPVVAISVLEAIAYAAGKQGLLLTALDAQRNELFVGEFDASAEAITTVREALVTAADFVGWLGGKSLVTHTPDATVEAKVREAGADADHVARPSAEIYARLGLRKYLAGEVSSIDELDANYIRRSDAEIFSAPKLGIKTN